MQSETINLEANQGALETKSDFVIISLCLWISIGLFAVCMLFLSHLEFSPPPTELTLLEQGSPEPFEQMAVKIAAIWFPLSALFLIPSITHVVLSRRQWFASNWWRRAIVLQLAIVMVIALAGFITKDPQSGGSTKVSHWFVYFETTLLGQFWPAALLIYGGLAWCIFNNNTSRHPHFEKVVKFLRGLEEKGLRYGMVLLALLTAAYAWFPAARLHPEGTYHLDVLYYSLGQVLQGEALLTDGFRTTYGLYPYVFEPFARLLGGSVASFTLICTILTFLSFILIAKILRTSIVSKRFLFWGAGAIFFWGYFYWKIRLHDHYFQFMPIRVIIPLFLAWHASRFMVGRTNTRFVLGGVVATIGILINIEFGLIGAALWLAAIAAQNTTVPGGFLFFFLRTLRDTLITVAIVATILGGFGLLLWIRAGKMPDLSLLFVTLSLVTKYGYSLLPMPLFHPWNLYGIAAIAALFWGARPFIRNLFATDKALPCIRDCVLFMLGLLSLWAFAYYGGRSHSFNLVSCTLFLAPVLVIFAEQMTMQGGKLIRIAAIPLLLMLAGWLPESLAHGRMYGKLVRDTFHGWNATNSKLQEAIQFVTRTSLPHERIVVLARGQGIILGEAKRMSAVHPGLIDTLTTADRDAIQAAIDRPGMKIYLEDKFDTYFAFGKMHLQLTNMRLLEKQGDYSLLQKTP